MARSLRPLGNRFRIFAKDEDGGILMFVLIMFLMMVVVSGGAVDFMHQETERARLQDGLDRGVLAAAAFSQGLEAEDTVRAYLASSRVPDTATVIVRPTGNEYSRSVTASAQYPVRTWFLKIIGINTLNVVAQSAATQNRNNLEISLILDITPSMQENNKIGNLKVAANDFIDEILTEESKEVTSVTLIPFGGQTAPSRAVFDQFNITDVHDYSHCMLFLDSDFNSIGLSTSAPRAQAQHFRRSSNAGVTDWCPSEASSMVPLTNDTDLLHARINGMGMHGWTGPQHGLKWGTIMLDPASRGVVTNLIAGGSVPAEFAGRPAALNDSRTLKFAIVMSDGRITMQYGVKASSYDTATERAYWATHELNSSNWTTLATEDQATSQFQRLCTAAKNAGITLFTIGFELDPKDTNGQEAIATLKACATDAAHFYNVQGLQIADAFDSIARTIQTVRLVN
jgi:Flp pilus assembly protein TadG